jgi:hypothetical protein
MKYWEWDQWIGLYEAWERNMWRELATVSGISDFIEFKELII